ncbi:MAG: tRNA (guanosine(37)-N1)-methyltransferase TrmD [Wolinella sp.]
MKFTFLTLFPRLISGYFEDSILKRAISDGLIEIEIVNLRDFSEDRFKKVDDYQVGGGAGLVIEPRVVVHALDFVCSPQSHTVFLLPAAKRFSRNDASRLAHKEVHIVFVCGRYEGIDERAVEVRADELFSIGDYILTGGEVAALVLCDAIARQIPNVLGNEESLFGESFEDSLLEAPVFTRARDICGGISAPSEYSKGNHARIFALKRGLSLAKTKYYRPDLYEKYKIQECNKGKK